MKLDCQVAALIMLIGTAPAGAEVITRCQDWKGYSPRLFQISITVLRTQST